MKTKNRIWFYTLTGFGLVLFLSDSCKKEDTSTCPIPTLISPENNERLDNGCTPPDVDAINWSFEWTGCPNAIMYNLYVKHPAAQNPVIDVETTELKFNSSSAGYISYNSNWKWKVRAFIDNAWGEWSKERTFEVEDQNNDCK